MDNPLRGKLIRDPTYTLALHSQTHRLFMKAEMIHRTVVSKAWDLSIPISLFGKCETISGSERKSASSKDEADQPQDTTIIMLCGISCWLMRHSMVTQYPALS